MSWQTPKTDWNSSQQGISEDDFNRIEGNTVVLREEQKIVTDYEGNRYDTVQIGSQLWTVQNARSTKYNDGTAISLEEDNTDWSNLTTAAYCKYENYSERHGFLYNWWVGSGSNPKKIAPEGWRVPTNTDFINLSNYLSLNGYKYDSTQGASGHVEPNVLAKSVARVQDWQKGIIGSTPGDDPERNNYTGLSIPASGIRAGIDGLFSGYSETGYLWTFAEGLPGKGIAWSIFYNDTTLYQYNTISKETGIPIRFMRDI